MILVSAGWIEALMVASALEGYEIPAFVIDDNICRLNPLIAYMGGGAKVIVRLQDVEAARDVLQPCFSGDPPYVGSFLAIPLSLLALLATVLRGRKVSVTP